MSPYLKTILRDLGLMLHIPGLMAILSLPICFFFAEYYAIAPLLVTASISFLSGQLLYRWFRKSGKSLLREALITVALSWGLIPCLGAIPFWLIASYLAQSTVTPLTVLEFQNPWNDLFESFSGFTSTGLSMALHPNELPKILQWWRSLMEWIGGVGMIVLMLSILEPSTDAYQLYYAEGRQQRIGLTVSETVRKIWWIYLLYTAIAILWLHLFGMPWWEAINHAMAGIATGGFSIKDDGIGAYNPLIQIAIIPIMIAGAISFSNHYQFLRYRQISALWNDTQHLALWILLVGGSLLLILENYWFSKQPQILESVFHWVSALGTCGFNTIDLQRWSSGNKLLLSLAMVFGAASGSTVGGVKLTRISTLFKGVLWRFQRINLQPHQMMRYKLDGKVIRETEAYRRVESAAILTVLWLSSIGLGTIILLHVVLPTYDLSDTIFEVASALGSVGLSTGISHPNLSWVGKLVLIILMWMGRLEIIPVLFLITGPIILFGKNLYRGMGRR